jgi:hypothetical protein
VGIEVLEAWFLEIEVDDLENTFTDELENLPHPTSPYPIHLPHTTSHSIPSHPALPFVLCHPLNCDSLDYPNAPLFSVSPQPQNLVILSSAANSLDAGIAGRRPRYTSLGT